ncbi:hypothetical protein Nos7107_2494 [Nostoc sp. PCC 7107]|nr:hypothetical protein Nos7107_2494 [Nostoc sp. PCC 7107]
MKINLADINIKKQERSRVGKYHRLELTYERHFYLTLVCKITHFFT